MSTMSPSPHSPAPARPSNGMGTAGFVLGLIGLIFSFIPLIGVIAWPLVILGLILSIVGLRKALNGRASNKGLAIAGIVLSAIGLLMCILYAAVFTSAVNETIDKSKPSISGAPADAQAKSAKIGQAIKKGDLTFTVTGTSRAATVGTEFLQEKAQGEYVVVNLKVTNSGTQEATLSDNGQKLVDKAGKQYSANSAAGLAVNGNNNCTWFQQINPGNSVAGKIVFDVPKGTALKQIELTDSMIDVGDPAVVTLGG